MIPNPEVANDSQGTNTYEYSEYLVPPLRMSLVHLNKPLEVSLVGQVALATGHLEVSMVGNTLGFDHPKVNSKLKSWNIESGIDELVKNATRYEDLDQLKEDNENSQLVGTVVDGGENPFLRDWQDDDVVVIGGANGLSRSDVSKMDDLVTIPTTEVIKFLTISNVVSSLTYHVLTRRGLWQKLNT